MLKNLALLVLGFVMLIKGADFFVDGSSSVAKRLRIPSLIVGLTIVAMGTSLPELAVSLSAALEGSNEIAVSNVVGSNLFNLLVVLGACALLSPVPVEKKILKREYPFSIIITIALAVMIADRVLFNKSGFADTESGILGRVDGSILLVLFVLFMVYTVVSALRERKNTAEQESQDKQLSVLLSIVFIVGGVAAIKFGGDFVVNSAVFIAGKLGMSETLVGLTIVAVGTSLPELVTSVVAARKGETGLAIGNVIGSNIFNILLILGVSSAICPITVAMEAFIDMLIVAGISILVYIFTWTKLKIERREGIIMLLIYAAYMAYAILR